MKRSQLTAVLLLLTIFILTLEAPKASTHAAVQHSFQIEEYELFHAVLEPMQHEALPTGDFARIRLMANELVTRGRAIVKLGVPKAAKPQRWKFAEARRKFDRALSAFMKDARKKNDLRLSKSFTAVHDLFEELADLVPTVYFFHPPPVVSLSCSPDNPEPGSQLICRADATEPFDARKQRFVWTSSGGRIVDGQGTSKITIDTTGQPSQKILVNVEVGDGNGHWMSTSREVQIAASEHP